jgi:serine/threonine protein kinase
MNQKGIYHCDLKESNILVDDTNPNPEYINTRIIDWGLSTKYNNSRNNAVPKVLLNRPFQYNVPFSSVLFNETFKKMYKEFLEENEDSDITYFKIHAFVIKYVTIWIDERGPGHLKLLNEICLANNSKLICIQTPVYKIIMEKYLFNETGNICRSLNIPFIDANYDSIRNNINFFYNSNHLNLKGVNKLNSIIKKDSLLNSILIKL